MGFRGPERIRTAVGAFAELSLATRPSDPLKRDANLAHHSEFHPLFSNLILALADARQQLLY